MRTTDLAEWALPMVWVACTSGCGITDLGTEVAPPEAGPDGKPAQVDASLRDSFVPMDAVVRDAAEAGVLADAGAEGGDGGVESGLDACPPPVTSPTPFGAPAKTGTITIDGDLSDWGCVPRAILDVENAGSVLYGPFDAGAFPTKGTFAAVWDTDAIYFSARVQDPSLDGTDKMDPYNNDSVELYVSNDNNPSGDYSSRDHHYVVDYTGFAADYTGAQRVPVVGLVSAVTKQPGVGFTLEAKIDRSALSAGPFASGQSFGFDVEMNHSDGRMPSSQIAALIWTDLSRGACSCSACCCGTTFDAPACDTLTFGSLSLK